MIFRATVIVGTQAADLNDYRTQFVNTCQSYYNWPNFKLSQHFHWFGKFLTPVMFNDFAIGQHLLDNPLRNKNYSDEKFTILSFGRSSFHLSALEAVYIKLCKPNLLRHKEFVDNLKILR